MAYRLCIRPQRGPSQNLPGDISAPIAINAMAAARLIHSRGNLRPETTRLSDQREVHSLWAPKIPSESFRPEFHQIDGTCRMFDSEQMAVHVRTTPEAKFSINQVKSAFSRLA